MNVESRMNTTITFTGASYTGCSLARKGVKATADSAVVELLRNAGAIVLCVTNIPEMSCHLDTSNQLYGNTLNPYDTRYSPGGSSGGEVILIAYDIASDSRTDIMKLYSEKIPVLFRYSLDFYCATKMGLFRSGTSPNIFHDICPDFASSPDQKFRLVECSRLIRSRGLILHVNAKCPL